MTKSPKLSFFLQEKVPLYQETITKAIDNIVEGVKDSNDIYATAVVAYALQLANHPQKTEVLQKLAKQSTAKGKSPCEFTRITKCFNFS